MSRGKLSENENHSSPIVEPHEWCKPPRLICCLQSACAWKPPQLAVLLNRPHLQSLIRPWYLHREKKPCPLIRLLCHRASREIVVDRIGSASLFAKFINSHSFALPSLWWLMWPRNEIGNEICQFFSPTVAVISKYLHATLYELYKIKLYIL